MRHIIMTAGFFVFAAAAHAASECAFATECYETEPCTGTSFGLTFRAGTGGPDELELVTDAETIGVAVGGNGKVAYLAGMSASGGGFHVLTVMAGTGEARYTAHIGDGPQVVTYLGRCELGQ